MKIAILPGDGIGPEIVAEARARARATALRGPATWRSRTAPIGGAGYDAAGHPLPDATLALARRADAILLGAVGGPQYDTLPRALRPEQGILAIRKALGLFANLRPAMLYPELAGASTLKPEVVAGLDLMIVRELTGDIYFGQPRGRRSNAAGEAEGFDTMLYSEPEIRRIARVGFEIARKRGKQAVLGRQGERARYVDPVARSRDRGRRRLSGRRALAHVCRQRGDAAGAQSEAVRRHRDRQYVRRHPLRRGVDARRLDRHAAVGFARCERQGTLRADPRLGAGHRRTGQGQSAGDDPVAGDDVSPHASAAPTSPTRIEGAVRKVLAQGLRTRDIALPGERAVGTRAMGDAVLAALQ